MVASPCLYKLRSVPPTLFNSIQRTSSSPSQKFFPRTRAYKRKREAQLSARTMVCTVYRPTHAYTLCRIARCSHSTPFPYSSHAPFSAISSNASHFWSSTLTASLLFLLYLLNKRCSTFALAISPLRIFYIWPLSFPLWPRQTISRAGGREELWQVSSKLYVRTCGVNFETPNFLASDGFEYAWARSSERWSVGGLRKYV